MTLDQAIDRYTNNARYERIHGSLQGCMEFRQLAEWLKDYKRLLEQEPYICDTCKHKGDGWDTEPCDGCCGNHSGYEPCDDAISRILKRMWNCRGKHTTSIDKVKMEQIIRDELPSVTPQQKYGKWITTRTFMHDGEYYCDRCKCDAPKNEKWDYCPNCGAKMQESEDKE